MTFNKDEISQLIADIDRLLDNSGNPLSKILSGQGEDEKNVLQRVKAVLENIDQDEIPIASETTSSDESQSQPISSLITRYVEQEQTRNVAQNLSQEQVNLIAEQFQEQIAVILEPLQTEVTELLERKASLVQEIRQLEQKRLQNYSLTQQVANQEQIIHEFIQVLTNRLVPNLIPYLTQNLASAANHNPTDSNKEDHTSDLQGLLSSTQGLEKLNVLARDLDQRLLSLDGTVNVVFQALERNINTYYQSLSQSLNRMHSQGIQSEQLMNNVINDLFQIIRKYKSDGIPLNFEENIIADSSIIAPSNLETLPEISQQKTEIQVPETANDLEKKLDVLENNLDDLDQVLSELDISDSAEIVRDLQAEPKVKLQESELVGDLNSVLSELENTESTDSIADNLQNSTDQNLRLEPEIEKQENDISGDLNSVLSKLENTKSTDSIADNLQNSTDQNLRLEPEIEKQENDISGDLNSVLSKLENTKSTDSIADNLQNSTDQYQELTTVTNNQLEENQLVNDLDNVLSELINQEQLTAINNLQNSVTSELNEQQTTNIKDNEEPEIIENLDVVLSHINADRSSAVADFTNPEQSELENLDEVDQLYASLFGVQGTEDIASGENNISVTNQVANVINQTNSPLSSELTTAENTTELRETSESVELWEEKLLPEDPQPEAEFTNNLPSINPLPDSKDTITVLTDLLVDFNQEQETSQDLSELEPSTTPQNQKSTQTQKIEPEYIVASPEENLLSLENEVNATEGVPQIILNESQIQQLDQDLANFDWGANSPSEQTTNLQNQPELVYENIVSEQKTNLQTSEGLVYGNAEIENKEFPLSESSGSSASENVLLAAVAELYDSQNENKNRAANSPTESAVQASRDFDNHDDHSNLATSDPQSVWYLGIDLGTTGISAALLDYSRLVVYPIYWSTENQSGETSFDQSFRLPAEVYLPTASIPKSETDQENQEKTRPAAVAQENNRSTSQPTQNLYSTHLKPFLQVAIPYQTNQEKWEPVLQFNEFSAGPLIWVLRSLSKLLLTLKSDKISTTPALIAHSSGIDSETFLAIINNLTGVICTCPSSYSEQYRFNVREAILTSQLVPRTEQIFFVEEAIASILPELDFSNSRLVQLNSDEGLQQLKAIPHSLVGSTLVLNVGAAATEMALVDVPAKIGELKHKDFMLHNFAYGGKAIEQDIICQLLLPPKSRQPRGVENGSQNTAQIPSWQPSIPGLDQIQWSSLNLEGLELPRVGEPDITARIRLQQKLESSLLGQGLLDAALALKIILQHQEFFTLELADQRWVLQRRDLETQIFVPYVRRLNREVNKLLVAAGVPTEAINQAFFSGGVASVNTINRWLRQKLPNAQIVQDLYLGKNGTPNCSRVAYGVSILPLYPQVLEVARQQYTDYFLFHELLSVLAENLRGEATRPLSFGEVLQLFESRGINTRICQQRLLAFLEGELPAGLVPIVIPHDATVIDADQVSLNSIWLTQKSRENVDYQEIASTPLFEKQGNLSYHPNVKQLTLLRGYLDAIKASTLQSIEEPLTVNFGISANS
ncbi:MAG: hypothetical protein F6K61_12160 [Sphaerospermopsis sp. SIO1G1]|nr:hypothetical protein [Sphaerospermopsis sp. SIO1G1]